MAQKLIDENLADSSSSIIDRRLRSRLNEADPKKITDAIDDLVNLVQAKAATPEDNLKLVQMYLATGNWRKASELLRNLVAKDDKEPRCADILHSGIVEARRISNADMYLERLENSCPLGSSPSAFERRFSSPRINRRKRSIC